MNRRGFLQACLAAATAPYVSTAAGVLMPVRKVWTANDLTESTLFQMLEEIWRQGQSISGATALTSANFARVLRPGLVRLYEAEFAAFKPL